MTARWERGAAPPRAGAPAALGEARDANPPVEAFLTGRAARAAIWATTVGEESEAIVCLDCIGEAWNQHATAREWLKAAPRP
jgi:hypothetical protein